MWRSADQVVDCEHEAAAPDPGWLQLNVSLVASPERPGRAGPLLRGVGGSLERWRARAGVECWFVRKAPGLRLRLRGPGLDEDARGSLQTLLGRERSLGRVDGWWRSTYEPERDRLGGEATLPAVHELFSAQTDAWLAWHELRGSGQVRLSVEWVSLALYADLLRQGTESPGEAWDVWAGLYRYYAGRPPPPPSPTITRGRLCAAALRSFASEAEGLVLDRGFAGNARFAASLASAGREELLVGGARTLLATLASFHWNRWGVSPDSAATLCAAMIEELHPAARFGLSREAP